jgi:hypothetical protein
MTKTTFKTVPTQSQQEGVFMKTIEDLMDYLTDRNVKFIYKVFKDGTVNLVTHEYCLIRDNLKYDILKVDNQKLILSTINQQKAYNCFSELF